MTDARVGRVAEKVLVQPHPDARVGRVALKALIRAQPKVATGTFVFTGTGTGSALFAGSAVGADAWTGDTGGSSAHSGVATGDFPTFASSVSGLRPLLFTPPVTKDYSDDYFFGRYGVQVGLSVVKVNGHYTTTPIPWLGDIADLIEGIDWFQGGRRYTISKALGDALIADGFHPDLPDGTFPDVAVFPSPDLYPLGA